VNTLRFAGLPERYPLATVSTHLGETIPRMSQKEKDYCFNLFLESIEDWEDFRKKETSNLIRVHQFHSTIDELIRVTQEDSSFAEKVTCKKGCSYCCNIEVALLEEEFQFLKQWIAANPIAEINRNGACPFLKDGLCLVYFSRPASCRKYFSLDVPEKCDTKTGVRTIAKFCAVLAEIFWSGAATVSGIRSMKELIDAPE
jgi:Fe-S-cluster containining protein